MTKFMRVGFLLGLVALLWNCANPNPTALTSPTDGSSADGIGRLTIDAAFDMSVSGAPPFPGARPLAQSSSVSAIDFSSGTVTLRKDSSTLVFPLTVQNGVIAFTLTNLNSGHWTLELVLRNGSGQQTFSGTCTVKIKKGNITTIRLKINKSRGEVEIDDDLPTAPIDLVSWNKLGSELDFTEGYLGIPLVRVGATGFAPGRFDQGIAFSNLAWIQGRSLMDLSKKGTVEFWVTLTREFMGSNVAGYPPSTAGYNLEIGTGSAASTLWQGFAAWNGFSLMTATIYRDAGQTFVPDSREVSKGPVPGTYTPYDRGLKVAFNYPGASLSSTTGSIPYASDTTLHLAFVWNTAGIEGGLDKVRLYADGVLVASSTSGLLGPMPTDFLFILGSDNAGGPHGTLLCPIDNVKVWGTDKTDFSDRITEGF